MAKRRQEPVVLGSIAKDIVTVQASSQMAEDYYSYAMAINLGRALPSRLDGFAPVHRRVLYAMHDLGLASDKPYRKCARISGEVMGRLHPHGSSYNVLVNMSTDWGNRQPLTSPHGNFGTTADGPASERYTECRLNAFSEKVLLEHLDKRWVSHQPTYDNSWVEPVTLPARLPMLLLRDTAGIGVATACRHVSYNLSQVAKLCIAAVQSQGALKPDKALAFVTQPDFAMGASVVHDDGMRSAIVTGQGTIRLYAKAEFDNDNYQIIVTELPQDVSPEAVLNQTATMLRNEKLDRKVLVDVRDESDRSGTRVVWELSKNAWAKGLAPWVLNELYINTDLQVTVSVNAVSVDPDGNSYSCKGVADVANDWAKYRLQYEEKRITVLLSEVQDRTELLTGQLIALANIVKVAKALTDGVELSTLGLSLTDRQIQAIEAMPLRSLKAKNRDKLSEELLVLAKDAEQYALLLSDKGAMQSHVCNDIRRLAKEFGSPMRTAKYEQPADLDKTLKAVAQMKQAEADAKGLGFLHDCTKLESDGSMSYAYYRSTSRTTKVPCTQLPAVSEIGIAAVLSNGLGYWLPVAAIPLNAKTVLPLKQMLVDYGKPIAPGTTVLWAEVMDKSKAKLLKRKMVLSCLDRKGNLVDKTSTLEWLKQITNRKKSVWLGVANSCRVL